MAILGRLVFCCEYFQLQPNRLIQIYNTIARDWNATGILLQRRLDLLDRLLAISKGYQNHEQDVFVGIAKARAAISDSQTVGARIESEKALGLQVNKFLAVAEAYPVLRSNQLASSLMTEIVRTEDDIAASRHRYNATAEGYNTASGQFPTNIAAVLFNFRAARYWNE